MNHTTQRAIIITMLAGLAIAGISIVGSAAVQAQPVSTNGPISLSLGPLNTTLGLSQSGISVHGPDSLSLDLANPNGGSNTGAPSTGTNATG